MTRSRRDLLVTPAFASISHYKRQLLVGAVAATTANLLNLLAPLPSNAAEFRALVHRLIVGRCHMNTCGYFSIDKADRVGISPKGELYSITVKNWEAGDCKHIYKCGQREGGEQSSFYVFCSKQKPAIISNENGKWGAWLLQIGNSYKVCGACESTYSEYWATCHGISGLIAASKNDDVGDALAKKLGYVFRPDPNNMYPDERVDLNGPLDALSW